MFKRQKNFISIGSVSPSTLNTSLNKECLITSEFQEMKSSFIFQNIMVMPHRAAGHLLPVTRSKNFMKSYNQDLINITIPGLKKLFTARWRSRCMIHLEIVFPLMN